MTVSKEQAQMLTSLACACRPRGAPRWDPPGVMAVLAEMRNMELLEVTRTLFRAAGDPAARTPAVIRNMASSYWHRDPDDQPPPTVKVDRGELCDICGRPRHQTVDHEYVPVSQYLAHRQLPDPEKHTAAAIKASAACEIEPTTDEETPDE